MIIRSLILAGGLGLLTAACTSTPDLSSFKSQGEALPDRTEAVVGFYPASAQELQTGSVLQLRGITRTPGLSVVDPAAYCADEANAGSQACRPEDNPAVNAELFRDVAQRAAEYSQRVAEYAAAGKLGEDEANPVAESAAGLLSFVGSALPIEAIAGAAGQAALEIRQRQRNAALRDTVDAAQPGVDAIAYGVYVTLGYCDIRPSERLMASVRAAVPGALPVCDDDDHSLRVRQAYQRDVLPATLMAVHQYAPDPGGDGQADGADLAGVFDRGQQAAAYLEADCSGADAGDAICGLYPDRAEATADLTLALALTREANAYNTIIAEADANRLTRLRAGRRLAAAYLAWADAHSTVPEAIDAATVSPGVGLFSILDASTGGSED